ncbi:MAG: DUF421 domain-containing protein [Clostridia bacterium]|nr:DUF421 domain-containing protein [Clostridia bacterium]
MPTLFIRTIFIYLTVFAVIRIMGKRQLSDMQPFDLVVTILIADVASEPISDPAVPLSYGVIPILALFLMHKAAALLSLRSERMRRVICGEPLIVISNGVVLEGALRAADFTLDDLTEQLRAKDVFSFSQAKYCILETNGAISVVRSGNAPRKEEDSSPAVTVVSDGKLREKALRSVGMSREKLDLALSAFAFCGIGDCFFVCFESDGTLHVQLKERRGGQPERYFIKADLYEERKL